ncbi:tRNA (adenosine(37)-N6)-threonylcarbamoyltransferase complex dimerization subunit type 1 TsaB [Gordonia sp. NPDC003585]|uniref:tRNA (adenosine(37)-N6)-threonylcarbamoyltransferase complex dimerization subunit type 1 TsaB n=1 Tax=Gordonia sp. NPDC003585 TaxID=3154275 RepID=UPI0033B1CD3E
MSDHREADGLAGTTVLAIDTATDSVVTGVAVLRPGGTVDVLAEHAVADHRRHAELLTTLMSDSLDESGVTRDQIGAVVVGCGPGPFTGLRVGMATGSAFADALGIPAYGVCSMDAVAVQRDPHQSSVVVVTDARRRELYWARYLDGLRVQGPEVMAPSAVLEALDGIDVDVAFGSPAHAELIGLPVGSVRVPSVAGLVQTAADAIWSSTPPEPLVPLYLRRPDAVERKVSQANKVGS